MNSFIDTPEPKKHKYQRYPLNMHRGTHPDIESRRVQSEDEEVQAASVGFTTATPVIPQPEEEKPTASLEDRVSALEDAIFRKKRGK